jgi:mercuric ion transport protein
VNPSTRTSVTAPAVDLVFDADCPNVDDARALLRTALVAAGLPVEWREWEHDGADTPAQLRGLGSPTILVNGIDVSGAEETDDGAERANYCRVYIIDGGLRRVPALDTVAAALSRVGLGT